MNEEADLYQFEDESAEDLFKWTRVLDFDAYYRDWWGLATTAVSDSRCSIQFRIE